MFRNFFSNQKYKVGVSLSLFSQYTQIWWDCTSSHVNVILGFSP